MNVDVFKGQEGEVNGMKRGEVIRRSKNWQGRDVKCFPVLWEIFDFSFVAH